MSKHLTLIKANEIEMVPLDGAEGELLIKSRSLQGLSTTVGAGLAHFKKASAKWEVKYDEVIYVISGSMYIIEDGEKVEAKQGDLYFLREGTEVTYGTDDEVHYFYALYPINWREVKA